MSNVDLYKKRLAQINEALIELLGKRENAFKQFGRDIYAEFKRYCVEKDKPKSFETMLGVFILAENVIEDYGNRYFFNTQEEKKTEELLLQAEKKEENAKDKMQIFVDKLNAQLNKNLEGRKVGDEDNNNKKNRDID